MKIKTINDLFTFFKQPKRLLILNLVVLFAGIFGNIFFQVFCIPSDWAIALLSICFSSTVFSPFILKKKKLVPFFSFINGISFSIFVYCILFLGELNYLGLVGLLTTIGLLVYVPHFFAIQLFIKNFLKPVSEFSKICFVVGIMICMGVVGMVDIEYKKALTAIEKFKSTDYEALETNFFTEKILGMHFLYHTEICIYDGWRPPKHEPLLIVGMQLHQGKDPLAGMELERRIELYRQFFPNRKVKLDCSCAITYGPVYHGDKRLDK